MSGLKAIRRRISSVRNTRQITRAMKLVSAAKLRRAQEWAENGARYSRHLNRVVSEISAELEGELQHPLLENRSSVKVRRVIVVAGERGLCGAYNTNIIKAVQYQEFAPGVRTEVVPVGRRAVSSAKRLGWSIVDEYDNLPEDASRWPVEAMARKLMKDYAEKRCDEVVVYFTRFVSALTQQVTREVILPLGNVATSESAEQSEAGAHTGGISGFSPTPEVIVEQLIPMLIKTKLYEAALQARASEHAARMTAMDSATKNAGDLIDRLRLFYNRARQSAITKELMDIIGGAEAIK